MEYIKERIIRILHKINITSIYKEIVIKKILNAFKL